jgi:hypothetical protein
VSRKTPAQWLRANKVDLASLTGTDSRALDAIAACWELYAYAPNATVLEAIRSLLVSMQPKCRDLTRDLIARSMDWSDIDRLWPAVSRGLVPDDSAARAS